MHFNLRGAFGIGIPVLLGSALAVGAVALPASATTYQDTALSASSLTVGKFAGSGLGATNSADKTTISLAGSGVTWALHGTPPAGVSLSGTTISASSSAAAATTEIVAVATDSAGNAEALEIPVTIAASSIQIPADGKTDTVSASALAATNNAGNVDFSATSSESTTITFAETNLPSGLTSGSPTLTFVGGTAAPSTYGQVKVTATDADGAALTATFSLTVFAQATSGFGNEVNKYGNGFDAFQQHKFPGAVIAGWPARQSDPATHFILIAGTHKGADQFEYAPSGSGSGLCISDPGGGWSSDPLPDGLIMTVCNTGPWQQFIPQSNGSLKNLATGLYVNPNGTGAQLRGGTSPTPWGGSFYTWTDFSNLPG